MKKLRLILLMSLFALTSGGCGLFGQSGEEKTPEPEKSPPQSLTKPPDKQAFEPKIPDTNSGSFPLIPSTSPNQRKQEIQAGRENPFAIIAIKPVIKSKVTTDGGVTDTKTNGVAGTKTTAVGAPKRLCQIEAQPPTNVAQAVEPPALPPPLPPVPNEARAVLVSGILKLGGTPVAIVQAPGEKVARQVTTGAVLSNGQVFVKGINANVTKPYIILEQYGIDVARSVGQPPEAPVAPPAPPAPSARAAPSPLLPVGPNGFGKVKKLVLLTLNIGEVVLGEKETGSNIRASGILCNDGYSTIKVGELLLQVEDKNSNAVIDSFKIELGQTYLLQSGQKAEFDGGIPKLRGRKQGDVNIKLIGWS